MLRGVVLNSRPNDLVWVSYGQREDFASPGSNYVRGVRQLIIFQSVRSPSLLEHRSFPFEREPFYTFVRHELQGAITDADQGQESPSVETSHSLRLVDA